MGFFDKIAQGLSKTRNSVVKEVKGVFGKGRLTEEVLEALEERLIAADISLEVTELLIQGLRNKSKGEEIDNEQLLSWMAEITEGLLPQPRPVEITAKPHVIMIIGVNGSGKTTTIGKLSHFYKSQGKKVMVAAGDTFRAGAVAQLEKWAERAQVEIVKQEEGSDAASVAYDGYAAAKSRGIDILIIDTAGRLHNKNHLMEELRKIVRVLRKHDENLPHETLLVVDGNTGQNAIQQGKGFNSIIKLDGLVITKLDGTAKGGAIIPICRELGVPVSWVGVGEGMDDLVPFANSDFVKGLFVKGTDEPLMKPEVDVSGVEAADYYLGV